jgi:hypothetical protein
MPPNGGDHASVAEIFAMLTNERMQRRVQDLGPSSPPSMLADHPTFTFFRRVKRMVGSD